jgi:hypothetical protein
MAKPSARQKTDQFLSQIGTAGGPIGAMTAPQLVGYGAADLANQVNAGLVDQYAAIRGQGTSPVVGGPQQAPPPIVPDLAGSYLNLSLPGSPLPSYGLLGVQNLRAAQANQDNLMAMGQQMLFPVMPQTGMLPLSPMEIASNMANQLQKQNSKQRRGQR